MSTIAILFSILFGSVSATTSTTVDVKSNKVVVDTKATTKENENIVVVDIMTP